MLQGQLGSPALAFTRAACLSIPFSLPVHTLPTQLTGRQGAHLLFPCIREHGSQ